MPPVTLPTMKTSELVVSKQKDALLLFVTFAVSVTPLLITNLPVPALEISSQVAFAVIVTVWPVAARASSPKTGTTPPVHVAVALKLPLAAEVMRAMA